MAVMATLTDGVTGGAGYALLSGTPDIITIIVIHEFMASKSYIFQQPPQSAD